MGVLSFSILELCNQESLLQREQFYLDSLTPYKSTIGYNIASVAGSQLGYKHTQEVRLKMSQRMTGVKMPEQTKQKIRLANTNPSAETRAKIAEASRTISADTRAKISRAHKGRIVSDETRAKLSVISKARNPEINKRIGIANKGRVHSSEMRAKLSASKSNPSDETRIKLSNAIIKRNNAMTEEQKRNISEKRKKTWADKTEEQKMLKQFCIKGHELIGENLKIHKLKSGKQKRTCRECNRINSIEKRKLKKISNEKQ
jgi:group I intron endonuclease